MMTQGGDTDMNRKTPLDKKERYCFAALIFIFAGFSIAMLCVAGWFDPLKGLATGVVNSVF